jgi:signal peptidase II
MPKVQRWMWTLGLLAGTVGFDQLTKLVARDRLQRRPMQSFLGDTFRLDYAENPGAFLGLGGTLPANLQFWLLTVTVGALLVGMLVWVLVGRDIDRLTVLGTGLMLGGGLSNWIDRVVNEGRVVDFLNLGVGSLRTGIFNVADIAIMAGAGLLFLTSFRKRPDPAPEPVRPDAP